MYMMWHTGIHCAAKVRSCSAELTAHGKEGKFFLIEDAVLKSNEEQGRNGLVCANSSLRN